jgi:hypothetical protein
MPQAAALNHYQLFGETGLERKRQFWAVAPKTGSFCSSRLYWPAESVAPPPFIAYV